MQVLCGAQIIYTDKMNKDQINDIETMCDILQNSAIITNEKQHDMKQQTVVHLSTDDNGDITIDSTGICCALYWYEGTSMYTFRTHSFHRRMGDGCIETNKQ
jgi:hypothetical protein